MRKLMVLRLGIALMVVTLASTAQALTFTVTSDTIGPIGVGDEIDFELTIDASDLSGSTGGFGISLLISGDAVFETVLFVDGGLGFQNEGQFRVNFGGPPPDEVIVGGMPLASAIEPNNFITTSIVTMASFFTFTPVSGATVDYNNAWDGPVVARVTLRLVDAGTMSSVLIAPGVGAGDGFDQDGVDILPNATFIGETIDLPEPHAIAMSLASLLSVWGIAGLRRRRLTSIVD
jgi:hypothetical protein